MQKLTDTMLFGHCIFYVRCWQCLETGKVSLYLWVTKSKRRKIIWCVCIFSCSFLVAQNSLTTQLPTVSVRLQIYFCSRMWTCIFCVTWCTVGMHNAMARIGLETNSLGDVSLGKEKSFIATINLLAQIICSELIFFFTFVIMQVVLLNIFVGQRWNTVMKSRLRVTP